jgi:membrane glycosyltransferase
VNGLHVSLLRRRKSHRESREYLTYLSQKLITQGPAALQSQEIKAVMYDPDTVTNLHYELWSASEEQLCGFWKIAIRQYNLVAPNPFTHLMARRQD